MKCVFVLAVVLVSCLAEECDKCKDPNFSGFAFEESEKCGCCPWPCCCKCVGTPNPEIGECKAFLDMAFLMDASGSIGTSDWVVAKQFFSDVVGILTNIGEGQRVAAIPFSTNATVEWNLDDLESNSPVNLGEAISKLENQGELTNIAEALEKANDEVFVPGIDDESSPNVVVLMTDGRSNYRKAEVGQLANELRAKASTVCIAVTNKVDETELALVCDEDKIFRVTEFGALQNILSEIQLEICPTKPPKEKCFCCCTPEMFWARGGANYYKW